MDSVDRHPKRPPVWPCAPGTATAIGKFRNGTIPLNLLGHHYRSMSLRANDPPGSCDGERIQRSVLAYLQTTDRPGDDVRTAQRLALAHSRGTRIVGFRRDGREVVVYETGDGSNALTIYAVGRDGRLERTAVLWRGHDLERWLDEHRHYLDWIAPRWR